MDYDKKISDIQTKIDIELKCKQGAENLRAQLQEPSAIELCESNIIESQKRLAFLNQQLKKLTLKKCQALGLEVPEYLLREATSISDMSNVNSSNSNIDHQTSMTLSTSNSKNDINNSLNYSNNNGSININNKNHSSSDFEAQPSSTANAAIIEAPSFGSHNNNDDIDNDTRSSEDSKPEPPPKDNRYSTVGPPQQARLSTLSSSASKLFLPLSPKSKPSNRLSKADKSYSTSSTNNITHNSATGSVRMSLYNFYGTLKNRGFSQSDGSILNTNTNNSSLPSNAHNSDNINNNSTNTPPYQRGSSGMFSSLFSNLSARSRSSSIHLPTSRGDSSISSIFDLEHTEIVPIHSKFDYWQLGAPISASKVAYKLKEVTYKLDVEQKVKQGTERMFQAVQNNTEVDKKRVDEVQDKLKECTAKVNLLHKAVQRYKSLYVEDEENDQAFDSNASLSAANAHTLLSNVNDRNSTAANSSESISQLEQQSKKLSKKGVTGKLHFKLLKLSNVTGKKSAKSELFIVFKVDGIQKFKSKTSKSKFNDTFDIQLDNSQDLEVTIYEKSGVILALFWCKLNDIRESLQFKSTALEELSKSQPIVNVQEENIKGALTAVQTESPQDISPPQNIELANFDGESTSKQNLAGNSTFIVKEIQYIVELEPSGSLTFRIAFFPQMEKKKIKNEGVIRRKPVKKVFPKKGHKFAATQFYQPMKCAYCNEFLLSGQGYQCQLCRFTCHKRCNGKVLTKCITKTDNDKVESMKDSATQEEEEDRNDGSNQIMKHRIPHRFMPTSNISANWCCHCGFMLPVGKKQSLKCTECNVTCHKECLPLVPDFCGLSPQMIDLMLRAIEDAERLKEEKKRLKAKQLVNKQKSFEDLKKKEAHNHRVDLITTDSTDGTPLPSPVHHVALGQQQINPTIPQPPSNYYILPPQQQNMPMMRPHVHQNIYASQIQSQIHMPQQQQQNPQIPFHPSLQNAQLLQQHPQAPLPAHPQQIQQIQTIQQQQIQPYQQQSMQALQKPPPPAMMMPVLPPMASMQSVPIITSSSPTTPEAKKDFRHSFLPAAKNGRISRYIAGHSKAPRGIGLDDFNFLAVLGKGNFGKVMLAEEKYTKAYYAIKVLKKDFIIENDEVESTKSEKRVFMIANKERFPFMVNLHSCFQTESRLYFVMEYVSGGDLMWHIQRQSFSEQRARFYACEVLLALEYFHKNNIVYRDLKLDNILLTLDGHVKIADYGLCKENMAYGSVTQTFCGTPEFMAPEILLEKPYTRAVDWWAFGVLIYEMILGQSPFKGDDEDEIFEAILEDEIVYPSKLNQDAVSLLQKLLIKDPSKRLGSSKNDAEDIKPHPYFKNVDWIAMLECRIPPPFFPKVNSPTDISNFDEEFTREAPTLTPCNTVLSSSDQEEFRGFTHVSDWAQTARSKAIENPSEN